MLLVGAPGSEFRRAAEMAREAGAEVAAADGADEALALLRADGGDLVMIDVMGDVPAFMQSLRAERFAVPVLACGIHASAERAVAAIRAGARDYVPLPPQRELIAAAIASVLDRHPAAIGEHPGLARATALARAVAPSTAPVLILGEHGAGKETMARVIHAESGRPDPLVVAECEGVPAEVLESELFGHEAGAFPGAAARRVGRFEQARGGTILLREVGTLPCALQARLLAVIQERRFTRVGGGEPVAFHARLIVSTSLDLSARVSAGLFRADLLARLGLVRIEVPALRERGDDILLLARHFAEQLAERDSLQRKPLAESALAAVARYPWPGNIRELEDAIHRAILLARGETVDAADMVRADGAPLTELAIPESDTLHVGSLVGHTVDEVERELILHTLERCRGNRTSASSILGISVRTMRNKLRTFIEAGIAVAPAL
jgi:DNA-binding NtrC family response regulator